MVLKANGQPIKSYAMQVKGGQLQRLARSTLGYEPHAGFISPRFIDTSPRNSGYNMRDAFWLKKNPK